MSLRALPKDSLLGCTVIQVGFKRIQLLVEYLDLWRNRPPWRMMHGQCRRRGMNLTAYRTEAHVGEPHHLLSLVYHNAVSTWPLSMSVSLRWRSTSTHDLLCNSLRTMPRHRHCLVRYLPRNAYTTTCRRRFSKRNRFHLRSVQRHSTPMRDPRHYSTN